MPPSTTALAAASLVSKSYLACVLPMFSRPPLPTDRYVCCHFLTALAGTPRHLATDSYPRPAPNISAALSLSDRSCLHRRSMDMESLPSLGLYFSWSKKWEAVQGVPPPVGKPAARSRGAENLDAQGRVGGSGTLRSCSGLFGRATPPRTTPQAWRELLLPERFACRLRAQTDDAKTR